MSKNRPYGDNVKAIKSASRVCEKQKRDPIEYESDLILGSISDSFVDEIMYERLLSSVRVVYPRNKRVETKHWKKKMAAKASKVITNSRHSVITPEHLLQTLDIGLDQAKQMLQVATQRGIRTVAHPIHRRY